ncbi:hypothetical protein MUP77_06615 [Candidatus Bathyarchaeota archaeon]|nr:hypothetical protein [Candidatus Bathyarchaeota archaeon]
MASLIYLPADFQGLRFIGCISRTGLSKASLLTIHDELIYELLKLDEKGKPTGDIIKIIETANMSLRIEELYYYRGHHQRIMNNYVEMRPDIVAHNISSNKTTAIELETDMDWDFAQSLQQIKKYKANDAFQRVVTIIPEKYEKYARLYKSQGFETWIWKATRVWECRYCANETSDPRTIQPKCSSCKESNLMLKKLKDVSFEEFKE